MWTQARITVYLATILAGVALLLTALGAGTYDPSTGMFDMHPVDVKWLAGAVAGPLASGLATVAALRGWGR